MHVATLPRILTPTGLSSIVFTIARDPSLWSHLITYRPEQRYWVRLDAPEVFRDSVDLWLLTWLPGQQTQPHDHGNSAAAFRVVRGSITEFRWSSNGTRTSANLKAGQSREVPAGAVHDVVNLGTEPAVSIHAYSPRLTYMKYYSVGDFGLRAERIVESDNPDSEWVR